MFVDPSSPAMRAVRRERELFYARSDYTPTGVRPVILESWIRSRARRLSPGLSAVPTVPAPDEPDLCPQRELLLEASQGVFALLSDVLSNCPFQLVLADSTCRLLRVAASRSAQSIGERINIVPGSRLSENEVGADALALCALLRAPVQTHWYEHYLEIGDQWAGNSAPIRNPLTGAFLGTFSIYGHSAIAHPRALELACRASSLIERELAQFESQRRLFLLETFSDYLDQSSAAATLCMTQNGVVVAASSRAAQYLHVTPAEAKGKPFFALGSTLGINDDTVPLDQIESPAEILLNSEVGVRLLPVAKNREVSGFMATFYPLQRPTRSRKPVAQWFAIYTFADIIGNSKPLLECLAAARKVADGGLPILISGESGTGKELLAHAIHNASSRRHGPFVPLSCGGWNDELLAAELFGYAEGAFTGAARGGRVGKFAVADTGTLFLDELQVMSERMQVQLLRVLEEKRILPLGSEKPQAVSVRLLCGTNVDLEEKVRDGTFRADLYYRINVLSLRLPPLRERRDDIRLLVPHLLRQEGIVKGVREEVFQALHGYAWPGNIRELRNVILQAAARSSSDAIGVDDLPHDFLLQCDRSKEELRTGQRGVEDESASLRDRERDLICSVMKKAKGHIGEAARMLEIHRVTLYRKLKKLCVACLSRCEGVADPRARWHR